MWDEEDGFFYDVLRLPDGRAQRLKVRSMVGLLPLCAATTFDGELHGEVPRARRAVRSGSSTLGPRSMPRSTTRGSPASRAAGSPRSSTRPSSAGCWRRCSTRTSSSATTASARCRATTPTIPYVIQAGGPGIPGLLPAGRVRHGHVRRQLELARADLDAGQRPDHPGPAAVLPLLRRRLHRRMPHRVRPADEPLPGGRGDRAGGWPTSSCRDQDGRRPVFGGNRKFQDDPHWRDCLLFYEYFHGDNGAGLGASHQTGWTGVIARLMHLFATLTPDRAMERGKKSYSAACSRAEVVGSSAGR